MPFVSHRPAGQRRAAALFGLCALLVLGAALLLTACGGSSSTLNGTFKSDLGDGTWSAWEFNDDGTFRFLLHSPGDDEADVADSGTYQLIGNVIETKSERGEDRNARLDYTGDTVQVEGEATVFKKD